MNSKKWLAIAVAALALLAVVLGVAYIMTDTAVQRERETYQSETFVADGGVEIDYVGNLSINAVPAGSEAHTWLAGCDGEDRNDQFDAYILRHEQVSGDGITYTYLVYYRHGQDGLAATPTFLEGENGSRRIDLLYTAAEGTEGYALSRLSVTLPSGESPRLRLSCDDDTIGALLTVAQESIPTVKN